MMLDNTERDVAAEKDTGATTPAEIPAGAPFKQHVIASGPNKADARETVSEYGVEIPEDHHSRLAELGEQHAAIVLPTTAVVPAVTAETAPQPLRDLSGAVLMNTSTATDPGAEVAAPSANKRGL